MISVRGLSKSYGAQQVLKSLDCEIREGVITGLAGPNACGKTTLIKTILGLVLPEAGDIYINGESILSQYRYRRLVGYMPQNADFPGNLTPKEIFSLLAALRERAPARLPELIDRFGLSPFLGKPCGNLSVGTRQKVAAVTALMFEPPLLILDEPTAGFDPVSCVNFKELLLETAQRGTTVLIVSHVMPELEQLIDDLIFLLEGSLLFTGPLSALEQETGVRGLEAGIVKLHELHAGKISYGGL